MLSWLSAAGLAVVALLLVAVPGWAVGSAFGFRGLRRWSLAPVLGIGTQSISAILIPAVHLPWNVATTLTAAAIWTAAGLGAVLLRRRLRRDADLGPSDDRTATRRARRRSLGAAVAGLAIAVVVFVVDIAIPTGAATTVGQSIDSMFHYDLVAWILQHQDAAATHVGALSGSSDTSTFYPDAWHTVVAFLVALTGCPIALAASAMTIAVTLVIWPLGVVALASELFGRRPLVVAAGWGLSGAATAFPWHFIDWGILYPNALSLALMAPVVALVVGIALDRSAWDGRRTLAVASLPLLLVALAIAQPNALFTAVVLLLPVGVLVAWRIGARRSRGTAALVTAAFLVVFGAAWLGLYKLPLLQRTVTNHWPTEMTGPAALVAALGSGFDVSWGQLLVPILALAGIVGIVLVQRRAAWLVAAYAITVVMYVIDAAYDGRLRQWLTGFWYTDERRLAANVAVVAVLLAVGGAVWLLDLVPWRRLLRGGAIRLRPVLAVGSIGALVVANLFLGGHVDERRQVAAAYRDQSLLTSAEAAFLRRVRTAIGSEGVVANIPSDGSGFGYALDGLDLLYPVMEPSWLKPWTPDDRLVGTRLNEIAARSDVCAAAQRLHLRYVLNLDRDLSFDPDDRPEWLGLRIEPGTPGFTPVLVDGEHALYRIDPC